MLRIPCPYCGVRDEDEFRFGGQADIHRPDPACSDAEWADYMFNHDNPRGLHHELWLHEFGCSRWFNVLRHTVTHEIVTSYRIGDPKPDTGGGRS